MRTLILDARGITGGFRPDSVVLRLQPDAAKTGHADDETESLSVSKSRVRTRQIGPSARSEVQPWVAPQGKSSNKAIGPICPFPKGYAIY